MNEMRSTTIPLRGAPEPIADAHLELYAATVAAIGYDPHTRQFVGPVRDSKGRFVKAGAR